MKALATKESVLVDEWVGCYRGGWKGVIVDEAFQHPAKVAFNLAKRIYEHAIDEGWIRPDDVVIDPFGGIGGCAFHGLMNGMRVVTCELESKFVGLSYLNRELWREKYTGIPGFNADNWIILQGDSRQLASLISEAGLSVSSPPYCGSEVASACKEQHPDGRQATYQRKDGATGYAGESAGQLGAMKEGDLSLAISSPPYANDTVNSRNGIDLELIKKPGGHNSQSRTMTGYGEASGQIGSMREGDLSLAVTSPPYNPPMSQDHNGSRGGKRGTEPSESGAFVKYGNSDGQIEGLSMEGFQAAISSPPFEAQDINLFCTKNQGKRFDQLTDAEKLERKEATTGNYGYRNHAAMTDGQLSAERGDTFWSASRVILEQLYSVLKPGSRAIFIVKAFVRDKKIVDFPAQWAQLCEAVGFKLIHDHHAMLTEHSGTQSGMFGADKEYKVKRVSFFRRLHEKKSPETAIEYENVLCFERA